MTTADHQDWLRTSLIAIVLIHFVNSLWHGTTHVFIPVPLTGLQTSFVTLVILLLPLIGAGLLLWTSRRWAAAGLIALSMLGALLFGFINHFMRTSPDNVLAVPENAWRHSFVVSAAALVATETAGTILGVVAAVRWRDGI